MSHHQPSGRPRRGNPPHRLRLYVGAVALCAALALLGAGAVEHHISLMNWLLAALLTGMVGFAHTFPVHMAPRNNVTVDTAPAFAAALILPLPPAIAASLAGIGGGETVRGTPAIQRIYNTAVAGMRTAAAAFTLRLAAGSNLSTTTARMERQTVAVVLAALAMYLTSTWLFELVVAIQQRRNPLRGWLGRRRLSVVLEASQYIFGGLIAVLGARWPVGVLFLAPPSVVVYRAFRDGVAVRTRAQEGLEEPADVIDQRDQFAAGHSRRTAELARQLAVRAGLPPTDVEQIAPAVRLHDIGTVGLSTNLLNKPGPLTRAEWREVQTHPEAGARLLARFPKLEGAVELVRAHHERWDGEGYSNRLRSAAIPTGARIIALADGVDAMQSERPYRRPLAPDLLRAEVEAGRGRQFDPALVDVMLSLLAREQAVPPRR